MHCFYSTVCLQFRFWAWLGIFVFSSTAVQAQTESSAAIEVNHLIWPGVRLQQSTIDVFFRTAEPVKWRQGPVRPNQVTLFLDNTTVTLANNARPLETHYFPGPLERITITPMEEPNRQIRVDIWLKYAAPFQQSQQDNVLSFRFQR